MKGHLNTACREFSSHVPSLLTRSPHLIPQDICGNSRVWARKYLYNQELKEPCFFSLFLHLWYSISPAVDKQFRKECCSPDF